MTSVAKQTQAVTNVMKTIMHVPLGAVKHQLDNVCLPICGLNKDHKGHETDFWVLVCMVNLMLSLYPMLCYFSISQNKHVILWMGLELQHVTLLVPGILFCMSLAMPCFKYLRASLGFTKVSILLLFLAAGALLIGSGIHVTRASYEVSYDLLYACGSSEMTRDIQSEWLRLKEFHAACVGENGAMSIQDCPGYAQQLIAPHVTYVQYIRAMETEFGCSGFCHFWARPLFNPEAEPGKRCASAVGSEMSQVGHMVGIPTAVIGGIVCAVGVVLASTFHL